jgi:phosphoglycolate phosphatase-like HAD superfamily hydrolase
MQTLAVDTVVLDVDGTLVDSVYAHVQAWTHAFHAIGADVPAWRIHRAIGMGGDRLVAEVAGQRVEDALGDEVRTLHGEYYDTLFSLVRALPGADDLLALLRKSGFTVVLATSGSPSEIDRAMDLLVAADVASGLVTSSEVPRSKPAADLVEAALERAGSRRALMIGDSVWDVGASRRAQIPTIGLRCGGFAEAELLEAGATAVFDDPADLVRRFDESGIERAST